MERTTVAVVALAFCRKSPDTQALIREAVSAVHEYGSNQHSGGAIGTSKRGTNAATYTLRRLKRDRPELAA